MTGQDRNHDEVLLLSYCAGIGSFSLVVLCMVGIFGMPLLVALTPPGLALDLLLAVRAWAPPEALGVAAVIGVAAAARDIAVHKLTKRFGYSIKVDLAGVWFWDILAVPMAQIRQTHLNPPRNGGVGRRSGLLVFELAEGFRMPKLHRIRYRCLLITNVVSFKHEQASLTLDLVQLRACPEVAHFLAVSPLRGEPKPDVQTGGPAEAAGPSLSAVTCMPPPPQKHIASFEVSASALLLIALAAIAFVILKLAWENRSWAVGAVAAGMACLTWRMTWQIASRTKLNQSLIRQVRHTGYLWHADASGMHFAGAVRFPWAEVVSLTLEPVVQKIKNRPLFKSHTGWRAVFQLRPGAYLELSTSLGPLSHAFGGWVKLHSGSRSVVLECETLMSAQTKQLQDLQILFEACSRAESRATDAAISKSRSRLAQARANREQKTTQPASSFAPQNWAKNSEQL